MCFAEKDGWPLAAIPGAFSPELLEAIWRATKFEPPLKFVDAVAYFVAAIAHGT